VSGSTTHPAMCRFCIVSCPLTIEIDDNRPVKARGNSQSPSYHGFCCTRGQALPENMANPHRLLHSQKRGEDGEHRPVASRQAVLEIAARLKAIKEEHGPDAVAVYFGTYSGLYPALAPVVGAVMGAFGTRMMFSSMTIDQPGKDIGAALLGGWEAGPHTFGESDVWMVIGSNPLVSLAPTIPAQNPGRQLTEALARGMRMIVIDPRKTQTARRAHLHIQPRPGHDAAILAAIINVVLNEGLEDAEFIADNVTGVEALREAVQPFTPELVAARADIAVSDIVEAARLFGGGRRGVAAGSTGANMSGHSSLT